MSSQRIQLAMSKCVEWHEGQVRKFTGIPYHTHPFGVYAILTRYTDDEDVLIGGLGHDWYEDTKVTHEEVISLFGVRVHQLILEVTDISKPEDGDRYARKLKDRYHLNNAGDDGKLIKLADILHNTSSITKHDKEFAKIYLEEKLMALQYLKIPSQLYHRVQLHIEYHSDCLKRDENERRRLASI